jgi:DNA-directed RNA polymerase subunit E"
MEKACRNCHHIFDDNNCPVCGSTSASTDWSGYIIILDVEKSKVAEKLNIKSPGRYALRVR